jgi:hypothetical protein
MPGRTTAATRGKPEPSEADAARRHEILIFTIDRAAALFGTALRVIGLLGSLLLLWLMVRSIAGKETSFSAVVKAAVDMSADRWVAWIVAGGTSYGLYRERKLRKKSVKESGDTIKQLETIVDPKRTSSGLTDRGVSRQEDRDVP